MNRRRWYDRGLLVLLVVVGLVAVITGALWLAINTSANSPILLVDKDNAVFNYVSSTLGLAVGFVAAAATVLLAIRAIALSREQTLFAARDAYSTDIGEFRREYHDAEALLISAADAALEHAEANRYLAHYFNGDAYELDSNAVAESIRSAVVETIAPIMGRDFRNSDVIAGRILSNVVEYYQALEAVDENDPAASDEFLSDIRKQLAEILDELPYLPDVDQATIDDVVSRVRSAIEETVAQERAGITASDLRARQEAVKSTHAALSSAIAAFVRYVEGFNRSELFRSMINANLQDASNTARLELLDKVERSKFTWSGLNPDTDRIEGLEDGGLEKLSRLIEVCDNKVYIKGGEYPAIWTPVSRRVGRHFRKQFAHADQFLPRFGIYSVQADADFSEIAHGVTVVPPDIIQGAHQGLRGALSKQAVNQLFGEQKPENPTWVPFSEGLLAAAKLLDRDGVEQLISGHLVDIGISDETAKTFARSSAKTYRNSPVLQWLAA